MTDPALFDVTGRQLHDPGSHRPTFQQADATWRQDAACLGLNANIFFPGTGSTVQPAKQICNGCTVRQECLDYALQTHSHDGVWGGMTYPERIRYARKRRRAA